MIILQYFPNNDAGLLFPTNKILRSMKIYFSSVFAKFTMFFMLLTCTTFAFTACGDDEDDNLNSAEQDKTGLVGMWKGTVEEDNDTYVVTMCFNADYTGWDNWDNEKETFTWYTDGDRLVFVYPEEDGGYDVDEYIYKVAGNKLYLYDYDDETGEKELECLLTRQ